MTKQIGFLGVGWIGRHRMEAMLATGAIEAAAISDPSAEMVARAQALAPDAAVVGSLDEMLAMGLDGVVIASPSALHAAQSIQALDAGVAVFCQKPLGRDAAETQAVIDAARRADRLLGVDLSYRFTAGMQRIAKLVRDGALGEVFAIDLTFHNAYGPGKPWFFDRAQSGGGCVIDLGVHLVDLALWLMDFPALGGPVAATLRRQGHPLGGSASEVEDYAVASFELAGGQAVRLACSWNLQAGREAEIGVAVYGTQGGAAMRNVNGSFFDFVTDRFHGTQSERLAEPPEEWGGRAAAAWAEQLAADSGFDPAAASVAASARVLDAIYRAAG
jgi:predicted dehydrogenase